jgi:hypothetical protein
MKAGDAVTSPASLNEFLDGWQSELLHPTSNRADACKRPAGLNPAPSAFSLEQEMRKSRRIVNLQLVANFLTKSCIFALTLLDRSSIVLT